MSMSSFTMKTMLKIIVLGDSGVGKTCLSHQYVNQRFIEEHKSTIGADLLTKTLDLETKSVTLQIWDTAGQERFEALGTAFYRGSDVCIIVYDVTNDSSFRSVESWRERFLDQANPENSENFPFVLIGNKSDKVENRQVLTEAGMKYAKQHNMKFYETSALTGENVEQAFLEATKKAIEREEIEYDTQDIQETLNIDDDLITKNNNDSSDSCAGYCSLL